MTPATPKAPRSLETLGDLDALERCDPKAIRAWFAAHRVMGMGEETAHTALREALERAGRKVPGLEDIRSVLEEER